MAQIIYTGHPNHNLRYPIGANFCLENEESFQSGVTVQCTLKNDPLPNPQFTITTTRVTNSGTNELLIPQIRSSMDQKTAKILLKQTMLSSLFESDTVVVNITCRVNNSYGKSEMTTSIRVCGELYCYLVASHHITVQNNINLSRPH